MPEVVSSIIFVCPTTETRSTYVYGLVFTRQFPQATFYIILHHASSINLHTYTHKNTLQHPSTFQRFVWGIHRVFKLGTDEIVVVALSVCCHCSIGSCLRYLVEDEITIEESKQRQKGFCKSSVYEFNRRRGRERSLRKIKQRIERASHAIQRLQSESNEWNRPW